MPLFLPLGGMIILGITTTLLGIIFWPEPKEHLDTSTEGSVVKPAPEEALPARLTPTAPGAVDNTTQLAPNAPNTAAVPSSPNANTTGTDPIDTADAGVPPAQAAPLPATPK